MKIVIPTLDGKLCAHFGHCETFSFVEVNPETKEILSRFLFLEEQKIVNLTEYTNTDLKFKYGVANLTLLTEYDTNYNELITLLHSYGSILAKEGYSSQALSVWNMPFPSAPTLVVLTCFALKYIKKTISGINWHN